jgi:hypothetical protein
MIEITKIDYEKDLNETVKLIQKGLDSSYSNSFFNWKHLDNPYGKSYGLVARERDKIVGLRMFMYWDFFCYKQNKKIKAIRPVDTVVGQEQRGKGLFKRLTLQGLEDCKQEYDLIFNTPNNKSLPGYLKMGWEEIVETPSFKLGALYPYKNQLSLKYVEIEEINLIKETQCTCQTNWNNDFLNWRYKSDDYKKVIFENDSTHFLVYKISSIKRIKMIVIYEISGKRENFSTMLHSLAAQLKIYLVYYLDKKNLGDLKLLKSIKRYKPVIVYKDDIKNVSSDLQFSLGDLEGKL